MTTLKPRQHWKHDMDFEEMKNAVKRAQEHNSENENDEAENDNWLETAAIWIR